MSRVGIVATWLAAGLLTLGLMALAKDLMHKTPPARPLSVSGTLPRREPPAWARWTVTEQLSAHHVLIVHVETRYLEEARSIARQIADPIRSRYAEVLVYVHRPGRPDLVAPRRVQWTRQRGYVETKYE